MFKDMDFFNFKDLRGDNSPMAHRSDTVSMHHKDFLGDHKLTNQIIHEFEIRNYEIPGYEPSFIFHRDTGQIELWEIKNKELDFTLASERMSFTFEETFQSSSFLEGLEKRTIGIN